MANGIILSFLETKTYHLIYGQLLSKWQEEVTAAVLKEQIPKTREWSQRSVDDNFGLLIREMRQDIEARKQSSTTDIKKLQDYQIRLRTMLASFEAEKGEQP